MKTNHKFRPTCARLLFSSAAAIALLASSSFAQKPATTPAAPLTKRTTYKTEKMEFGAGGTVSVVGAPKGSITIEGWQKNEVEVSAEIEVQAETEADLALLAQVNGFILDQDFGHVRVITVGTNDRNYLKRTTKKFPKHLLDKPFKIDYRIKVPVYCDLEITGGRGDFNLSKVEGAMQIRFLEGDGDLALTGGAVSAVFGNGSVKVKIASRSWRGRHADIQLAGGTLDVELPANLNADLNVSVLRTGKIENSVAGLKPRQRTTFNEKSMAARAGSGGATLTFTVGDGTLKLSDQQTASGN